MTAAPEQRALPAGAGPDAVGGKLSRTLPPRRDEFVAQAVREHEARLERRRLRSRRLNVVLALLFGLAAAWLAYSYFFIWK